MFIGEQKSISHIFSNFKHGGFTAIGIGMDSNIDYAKSSLIKKESIGMSSVQERLAVFEMFPERIGKLRPFEGQINCG